MLLCRQTVQGMVIAVAGHVGQGIITVVVIGIDEFAGATTALEVVEELAVDDGVGTELVDEVRDELTDGLVVLLIDGATDAGLTGVELAGQALLLTPVDGFFVGIPGTFSSVPIHSLSQSMPGLAFWRSSKVMPKYSAIL